MRHFSVLEGLALAVIAVGVAACGSSSSGSSGSSGGAAVASGGVTGTGANSGSTGGSGSGGAVGATGGSPGSGGKAAASGGINGSGGFVGTGGEVSGGGAAGGVNGAAGRGGSPPSGGLAGKAAPGCGGVGAGAAAGAAGTGGTSGTAACSATATAKPGETMESISVGGMTRTFVQHIPPGYDGKTPVPVVFDFHPLGGTGASWKGSTNWGSVADSNGFIMIWPDGVGNSWNVGRCCSTAQSQNVDDVAFTKAIIGALQAKACIDPKRVYATGCSNGGGMAFKVACDAADMIAAVAPVDFDCVTNTTATPSCGMCTPARPISEIQFRGTSDSEVPYDGGSGPRGTMFPGAKENFSEWGGINMCTGTPQALADNASCQVYPMCAGDAQTILCSVQNGTHCGNYKSFGIVDLAWGLFQKESLP